ncbi:carotenoid oxygenase family protein [Gordonia crocea]|uniref:Dioxygenase n=1 Tax=Gordonia crocea TaxID=589162 RepID=A0A7I9UXK1_9ACTN|nr:carotenoid oxygenase family protein [Gordonia crocea]GED97672.1 lignostilbene alpha-beta-dioxygenase [Gordonia crocea]
MTDQLAAEPAHRPGSGPWDAQEREFDYRVDEITGTVPASLRGVLYRIGPGRLQIGGHRLGHIFDGDGMVSRFEIGPEGVGFRNRYVRTRHFAKASSRWIGRGIGTQRPGGFLANAFRLPANVSNTNVVAHAGGLFSLWEGGRPYRLDPESLATIGREDFDGTLRLMGAFSAHPKVDPASGEMFNFGIEIFPRPMLRTYRRDRTGAMTRLGTVPLTRPAFCHDFALTEHYLVFLVDPIVVGRPVAAALGLDSLDHCLTFDEKLGTRVALVPRDGGATRILETDALFHFHATNAFEDGDDVVVEVVAHDAATAWSQWNEAVRDCENDPGAAFGGRIERIRIGRRRVSRERIADTPCEFPQLDHRYETRAHPVTYAAAASAPGGDPDSITAVDHTTGRQDVFTVEAGNTVCEAIFAADPERDRGGWLMSVEHVAAQARSRLLILDTDRLADGPVATAELANHIPMGFHGTFVPSMSW